MPIGEIKWKGVYLTYKKQELLKNERYVLKLKKIKNKIRNFFFNLTS